MALRDFIKLAWRNLARNKWRAFLTMLGIIIGVAGVIMILSVGAGAQSLIFNQIQGLGSDLIGILPGAADDNGPPASVMGVAVTTLVDGDLQAIMTDSLTQSSLLAGAGYVSGVAKVTWENQQLNTSFTGVSASYPQVESTSLERGRFYTDEEDSSLARVAVLGNSVAHDLFAGFDPIGQKIKINNDIFRVIGVLVERGGSLLAQQDDEVFIPLHTAQKVMLGINHLSYVRIKVQENANLDHAIADIETILRQRHNIADSGTDDFSVRSQTQALDVLGNLTNALRLFLAAIAAIALLVGGIGIMNIMLVSVTERTAEIGLRKAVGAPRHVIVWQFLTEAIFITLAGGIIGIIIGALLSALVAVIAHYLGYYWEFIVSWQSILISCGVAVGVGLFFGYYPARQAARLDPVEALRYE
ncbi:MAG: ABC transporter permease [Candidatus Komeilibacteria bacterium]